MWFKNLLLVGFCFILVTITNAQTCTIFPHPQNVTFSSGMFEFSKSLSIQENEDSKQAFMYLNRLFEKETSTSLVLTSKETAQVILNKVQSFMYTEGYTLNVTKELITIQYTSYEGFLNAMQSLNQLIYPNHKISCLSIQDEPAFQHRGMHLDCSRHFFKLFELKKLIDQMAKLKLNRFHWHLTDDQGWRIEIKKYPLLTQVGAWRDSTLVGHFSTFSEKYEKKRYGGFYTQDEVKELVEYAHVRGIEILPEIEMPGHARAALAAYPELGCTEKQLPVAGTWGVFDDVFCSQEKTRTFLKDVLAEVMPLFPYSTIHIGGDECPKTRWNTCAKCQKVMQENGLKDAHELQSFFIKDIEQFVNSKGKKIIGWDEILEGGLAPNAQVMSWQGIEGGIKAAKEKHFVVMTPVSHCYFDYYQSSHPDEPLAIGGYLPLQKVYSFNPLNGFDSIYHRYVLGAQANLWTEYISTLDEVEYFLFPRLVAMAEVLWSRSKLPYEVFVEQMASTYLPRLKKQGIDYSRSFLDPILKLNPTQNGITYKLVKPISSISYTQDGKPVNELIVPACDSVKQVTFNISNWVDNNVLRSYQFQFTSHLALGKPVTFITNPSPKYNINGSNALTDGVVGGTPWKGSEWLGYDNDTVAFTLDLKKLKSFKSIQIGTLNDPGSWIYRPISYKIELSKNGNKFKKCASGQVNQDLIEVQKKMKAKVIRVWIFNREQTPEGLPGAGFTPWTFINELIISK